MIQQCYFWISLQKNWKIVPKTFLYVYVHSSVLHNSQEVEATKPPSYRWTNKQNVACIYNGILSCLEKEGNPVTCYKMEEPSKEYELSQSWKANAVLFQWYELSRIVKFIKIENRMVIARGWRRGKWVFNVCRVSVLNDERYWRLVTYQCE